MVTFNSLLPICYNKISAGEQVTIYSSCHHLQLWLNYSVILQKRQMNSTNNSTSKIINDPSETFCAVMPIFFLLLFQFVLKHLLSNKGTVLKPVSGMLSVKNVNRYLCLFSEPSDCVWVGGDAEVGHGRGGHGLLFRVRPRREETTLGKDLHTIREYLDVTRVHGDVKWTVAHISSCMGEMVLLFNKLLVKNKKQCLQSLQMTRLFRLVFFNLCLIIMPIILLLSPRPHHLRRTLSSTTCMSASRESSANSSGGTRWALSLLLLRHSPTKS